MFFSVKAVFLLSCISMNLFFCNVGSFADDSPPMRGFGIATHMYGWDDKALLPVMKQLGVSVFRDSIPWQLVETKKGVYKIPPKIMSYVERITGSNIKMIVALYYSNKLYDNPHDPEAFANYCRFVASKLKGKNIAAFEIYNEPNGWFRPQYGGAWNGKDNAIWIEKFAEYMSTAAAAIREVDKTTPIISGGGVPCATAYLMKRFPKAFKNIDGITEHPYSFSLPPETVPWGGKKILKRDGISVADDDHSITSLIDTIRQDSKKYLGRELPVWVTEVGFSCYYDQKRPAQDRGYTKETQAMYVARSLVIGLSSGAKVWCIYNLMDTADNRFNSNYNFGMVRHKKFNYEPKPVFYAVQRVSRLLGSNWQYVRKPKAKLDVLISRKKKLDVWQTPLVDPFVKVIGPMMHWFKVPDGYVTFVWNSGRYHGEFNAPFGDILWTHDKNIKKIDAFDVVTGKKLKIKTIQKGNKIRLQEIPVGGAPIAIKWTMGTTAVSASTKTPAEKYNALLPGAKALSAKRKFGEAKKAFENILKIEGLSDKQKNYVFSQFLNSVYRDKKYQDVLTIANQTLTDGKATPKMKTFSAYLASNSANIIKKYEDMEKFGKTLSKLNSKGTWHGRGYLYQGQALKGQKKYDKALALLTRENISHMHPNDQGVAYLERGHMFYAQKKYPEAIVEYSKVYELPKGLSSHKAEAVSRIIFTMDNARLKKEVAVWIKRIDGAKNKYWKARALFRAANFLEKQGKWKAAKEKWEVCKNTGPWWANLAKKKIAAIDKKLQAE